MNINKLIHNWNQFEMYICDHYTSSLIIGDLCNIRDEYADNKQHLGLLEPPYTTHEQ